MNAFQEIFSRYDTDKVQAGYHKTYEKCFGSIRNEIKLLFEIGVNRGGSVRAFHEYFPNAIVVGIDINPACYFEHGKIKIEIGDATNIEFIDKKILAKYGCPDIVIDDGSHMSCDIRNSFNLLYSFTRDAYVIEDLGTQDKNFANGLYVPDGIPATDLIHHVVENAIFKKNYCKEIFVADSIFVVMK